MDRSNYGFALAIASSPIGVVSIAVLIWLATALAKRPSRSTHATGRSFHKIAGATGGLLALSGWALGLLAALWSDPFDTVWWGLAAPLAGAVVAPLSLTLSIIRHPVVVEEPVVPVVRRTWSSFTNRRQLSNYVVAAALLLALSVVCGVASEPGVDGSANITSIGPSGGYGTLYGWTAGLPVVLATIALVGFSWCALHLDAARPFARVDTAENEIQARTAAASIVLTVTFGAMLLSLGTVFDGLASSAAGQVGFQVPGSDPYMWSMGFSSISPALRCVGWALQVAGAVALLRVMASPFRGQSDRTHSGAPVVAQR